MPELTEKQTVMNESQRVQAGRDDRRHELKSYHEPKQAVPAKDYADEGDSCPEAPVMVHEPVIYAQLRGQIRGLRTTARELVELRDQVAMVEVLARRLRTEKVSAAVEGPTYHEAMEAFFHNCDTVEKMVHEQMPVTELLEAIMGLTEMMAAAVSAVHRGNAGVLANMRDILG